MRNKIFIITGLLLLLFQTSLFSQIGSGLGQTIPVRPAFPGAEGWGKDAIGWRFLDSTKVLIVDCLDDNGNGSLRAALEDSGPRIVVFNVAGTIKLNSMIRIIKPFCYIAGQSAPGDGITLRFNEDNNGGDLIQIRTHDVVIRYLKIRPGPGCSDTIEAEKMTLIGYEIENRSDASRGSIIKIADGRDYGSASYVIKRGSINVHDPRFYTDSMDHRINIRYVRETDGTCSLIVSVIDGINGNHKFDDTLRDTIVGNDSFYMYNFPDTLNINYGDKIYIQGYKVGGAFARVDYIQILSNHWGDTDGITLWPIDASSNDDVYNIIIDHCSISWTSDENICLYNKFYNSDSIDGGIHNVTIQWCILSEGLNWSTNKKGRHSTGLLVGDGCNNISIHHNLFAHNHWRNPDFKSRTLIDIVNNVIYNWGWMATNVHSGHYFGPALANLIKNYYKIGPSTLNDRWWEFTIQNFIDPSSKFYLLGNIGPNRPDTNFGDWSIVISKTIYDPELYRSETSFTTGSYSVTTYDAVDARDSVLKYAGANIPLRDAIDTRIVNEVILGTGKIINHPSEVGGWIDFPDAICSTDTDSDGMPDWWENQSPQNSYLDDSIKDANLDGNNNGYLNIEEYLNSLVSIINTIYEAEHLTLDGDYIIEERGYASNDSLIRIDSSGNTGNASFIIDDKSGPFAISVRYVDEDDGESVFELRKNNTLIESWIADDIDSGCSLFTKTFYITLSIGDEIKIIGTSDEGEYARVDYVTLIESDGQVQQESVTDNNLPLIFSISQNYPNPFNSNTTIEFFISRDIGVDINVYNILGQKVKTLISGIQPAGRYSLMWDRTNEHGQIVANGVYFYQLNIDNEDRITRKMLLVK